MPFRLVVIVLLSLGAGVSVTHAAGTDASLELLQQQYEQRHAQYAEEMESLASNADAPTDSSVGAAIRCLIPKLEEQTLDVDALPHEVQPALPASLSDAERHWRAQLQRIRTDYAHDLYSLSRRALTAGHVSLAFHLVREVAFHDPDHRVARQLLGYVRHEDSWVTPHEQFMLRRGYVWHDRFGWLPQPHVDRYEQGERYYRGRWMSASDEAVHRHDFRNAWEIESDHFLIRTNQSLERGVQLSVALERFHRFFCREFAPVFNSPQQMRQLFANGSGSVSRTRGQRHEIHYYQSREEFVFRLREKQPGVELSNGVYLPAERTAYFFYNPDDLEGNIETMYHEVTHQLLSESQSRIVEVGQTANFWLIEGIACYLESFEIDDAGAVSVGDPRHIRMHWARERRLRENFFVPLTQFTQLDMAAFQPRNGEEMLQKLYSQATGLTHFFMHYENGRYRDALIEHLSQIYSPDSRIRAQPEPLDHLTGVSFQDLDRQYLSYLTEMQSALDGAAAAQ